ncbi:MAG: hypothetical protein WBM61_17120 [Woeseiaceae bacterium]
MNDDNSHWLTRPATIRKLWWGFSIVLALTVAAQLLIYVKGYFGADGWFGFGAVFGFLSCLTMVLVAKGLGFFLKRSEDYYAAGDDDV